jgi:hypothetical protein
MDGNGGWKWMAIYVYAVCWAFCMVLVGSFVFAFLYGENRLGFAIPIWCLLCGNTLHHALLLVFMRCGEGLDSGADSSVLFVWRAL